MNRPREILVGSPSRACVDGRARATAEIDGTPVFFESADAEPTASIEAFANPFILPALEQGRILRLGEAPGETWLRSVRELVGLFRRWWGYAGPDPLAGVEARPDAGVPRAEGAQCFSGGIDSFYTLRSSPHRRDILLGLVGFDIALSDERREQDFTTSLREIAAGTGRRAVVLRTSIRSHPLLAGLSWDREHGSVLAAAGHALSDTFGSLVIPSSWGPTWTRGWGSHWDADPLWSSDRLRVIHDDASLERWDKVPSLADDALFFRHLRVCWENRLPAGNCGLCEKCLRTRVLFARYGLTGPGEAVFDTSVPLAAALDRLASLPGDLAADVWESHHLHWTLPADVHAAVARLCERSRRARADGRAARLARRVVGRLRALRRTTRLGSSGA
ncbi:MAG: hypothetical protein ACYTCU_11085 [Planctomycetota bacterium]|jgi:hypothetical protein